MLLIHENPDWSGDPGARMPPPKGYVIMMGKLRYKIIIKLERYDIIFKSKPPDSSISMSHRQFCVISDQDSDT